MSYDPASVQKRLGDGFYEQRLIREQIAQLTGRRFLTGYANDEQQYQALMTNGATFAQAHQLIPGIALTAAQVAQLTSDIVWLVEQTVTLPDGTTTQALVPQVYIRLQPGDLSNSGSLLSGETVHLNIDSNLENSGTIAGRSIVSINADNIHNLGGRISGSITQLNASQDINNLGGTIAAQNALLLPKIIGDRPRFSNAEFQVKKIQPCHVDQESYYPTYRSILSSEGIIERCVFVLKNTIQNTFNG